MLGGFGTALRTWMAASALNFLEVSSMFCAVLYLLTGWLVRR
jgi:hypothetical protein